jgi:hypothetical protein
MTDPGFRVIRLDQIPPVEGHDLHLDADWKPVRHHLDIDVFGINAYQAAEPGQVVIEEHDEADDYEHHELYFVHTGRAEFTVGGETFEAPAGTLVYLDDPTLVRKAVAAAAGGDPAPALGAQRLAQLGGVLAEALHRAQLDLLVAPDHVRQLA